MNLSAEDFYIQELHDQYKKRHYIKSSMDVDAVKKMLAEGRFNGRQIREAVQNLSPIAIEPGRDASYYQNMYCLMPKRGLWMKR